MNVPDINVVFSFCVPGHIFENRSRNLLLSDKEFIFSDRGFDVLNLVINRFLEGLTKDLIDIVIARKEEVKEILEILGMVNDDFRKEIMQRILIEVGIRDLEDIEILSDTTSWIFTRIIYVMRTINSGQFLS
ncbi:MAG: hypothetical protein ISS94_00540 [Candidatus Syntrophoarchaeum sp.]|nr:hypothetical protein [Candidatus Syntrophoarchaeum sp.]